MLVRVDTALEPCLTFTWFTEIYSQPRRVSFAMIAVTTVDVTDRSRDVIEEGHKPWGWDE